MKARALALAALLGAVAAAASGCGGRHAARGDVLITASRLFDGMVEGGDTTVRNLGAPLRALRPPSRRLGPLVLMAGPLMSVSGGYPETVWGPSIALDVRSPADARAAVRMLARRGAAVIKIALDPGHGAWPMLSVAEVRAIVAEAHAQGLRVTAHAMGAEGVQRALAGGVDELAHTPCGATAGQIRQILRRHVPFVGTLHVEELADGGCLGVARKLVAGGDLRSTERTSATRASRRGSTCGSSS